VPGWTRGDDLRAGCGLFKASMNELTQDQLTSVAMLFEAHREKDPMRIEAAMRQLEFLDCPKLPFWMISKVLEDRQ
jgi:hypothetical protein